MGTINRIVEENDTGWGRVFDLLIQSLIVLSLVSFSIETLPDLSDAARQWLCYIEIVTVAIFTVEYFLRLFVAERKLRFIFSFFGIIDLLAEALRIGLLNSSGRFTPEWEAKCKRIEIHPDEADIPLKRL